MNLISQDYLIHHGVKGMKWGVRKDEQFELKSNYWKAKNEYKKAKKSRDWAFKKEKRNITGKAASKAAVKLMNADVAYRVGKSKSKEQAQKAERNAYTKAIRNAGMKNSPLSNKYGKQTERMYNEIVKNKGKAYADRIESRAKKQLYATIAGGLAVSIGANYLSSLYMYKY